jgi:cytochrome c biogenesis factor
MFAPISREGALVVNNLFLSVATATVLLGTLYPLLLRSADRRPRFPSARPSSTSPLAR